MRIFTTLSALALTFAPAAALAQATLAPNQQIRAWIADRGPTFQTTARVTAVGRDSVWLDVRGTREVYPLSAIVQAQALHGHQSRAVPMLIGTLVGTALGSGGALLDRGLHKDSQKELVCGVGCVEVTHHYPYPAGRSVAFVAGGAAVGALIGYVLTPHRWEPVAVQASAQQLPPPQQP
jgi:hypothetical protein